MAPPPDLRFPVGKFLEHPQPSADTIASWLNILSDFPQQLSQAAQDLTDEELSYRYRPGGWTIRQVVHHCADSHMNAYSRFKLALTEENPTIKPYDEGAWAELPDSVLPIESSLAILEGLHQRWCVLIRQFAAGDWDRTFVHPEHGTTFSMTLGVDTYQWHCRHHLGHVHQALRLKFLE